LAAAQKSTADRNPGALAGSFRVVSHLETAELSIRLCRQASRPVNDESPLALENARAGMMLDYLIDTYGYLAILIGTFLEGETVLVLGGIAARLSYLDLPWVIVCAFTGTVIGDQLFFFLGRYHGTALLRKYPAWNKRAAKAGGMLERHRVPVILGYRFLYGLRSVTPFVIGMSRVRVIEFVVLNMLSAAVWANSIGALGYLFGHGLELVLGNIKRYEIAAFVLIVLSSLSIWLMHMAYTRRKQKLTGLCVADPDGQASRQDSAGNGFV
jgi:membrane protein DedA with SNARE-associated domain